MVVLSVGYYFVVRLYREWISLRQETHAAGRLQAVVAADCRHLVAYLASRLLICGRNCERDPPAE